MYNEAKLKSLQELRGMLDEQMLGKLRKPEAAPMEVPGELPAAAHAPEAPAAEQEDPAALQALLDAYGKDEPADEPVNVNGSW